MMLKACVTAVFTWDNACSSISSQEGSTIKKVASKLTTFFN